MQKLNDDDELIDNDPVQLTDSMKDKFEEMMRYRLEVDAEKIESNSEKADFYAIVNNLDKNSLLERMTYLAEKV